MSKLSKIMTNLMLASLAMGESNWYPTPNDLGPNNRAGKRGHYRNNSAQKQAQKNKALRKRRKKNKAAKQARKITRK